MISGAAPSVAVAASPSSSAHGLKKRLASFIVIMDKVDDDDKVVVGDEGEEERFAQFKKNVRESYLAYFCIIRY